MKFWTLIFLLPSVAMSQDVFSVYGRVIVSGDDKKAECVLCVDCEKFSGHIKRPFSCRPMEYLNGSKVHVDVRTERVDGKCGVRIVKLKESLAPEKALPDYPDKKSLQDRLRCDGKAL
jgi:hypothetical protein